MKAILDRAAMRLAYILDENSARPVFRCVRIGDNEIVAANGTILAHRAIKTEPQNREYILVPAKCIVKLLELGAENATIESVDDKATLKADVQGILHIVKDTLPTSPYPDYKEFQSKLTEKPISVNTGFTLSLMEDVLRVLREDRQPLLPVKLILRGRQDAFQLLTYGDDITEVFLMPCVTLGENIPESVSKLPSDG